MKARTAEHAASLRAAAEEAAAHFPALMIEADRIASTVAAGLHGRRRAGPGESFWQHRAYAFGDPVGAIDWRQSARAADRLYVRQNEWEAAAAVWIWRDASASLDYRSSDAAPTKARRADVLAAALAILLSQAGERIGLLGEERRPFHGRGAPALFLQALLGARDQRDAPPPRAPVGAGARVVMLSDFFMEPDALEAAVRFYAGAGAKGALVQVVDPAEEEFPFVGRTRFEDLESPDTMIFGSAGAVAHRYRAAFNAHRESAAQTARRHGWSFIAHRTDRPPQTALLALFGAIGDARLGM